jgi:hypothetical protein
MPDGSEIWGAYVPDPNFSSRADKEQDIKEAQRLISIAENWITFAKKIGDATALSSRLHTQPGRISMTAITQMTRFKSDKTDEMVKNARAAKIIFEKHGAEFLRVSRFHTGSWAGEWLVVTRFPSWAAYGKAQEGLAKDPDFARLMANTANIAELSGRNITVGIDL